MSEPNLEVVQNEEPAPDLEAAQKMIDGERTARAKAASEEVAAVLERHRCKIEVGMLVMREGNIPQLQIVAQP